MNDLSPLPDPMLLVDCAQGFVPGYTADQMHAYVEADRAQRIPEGWQLVSDAHPPPHATYLVDRDSTLFTAKVCYGMHTPWWVVRTMSGEADPVDMRPTDKWTAAPKVQP